MKNKKFKEVLRSFPEKNQAKIKKSIMRDCVVTEDVFHNWRAGRTEIPDVCKSVIAKIFRMPIESIFTKQDLERFYLLRKNGLK